MPQTIALGCPIARGQGKAGHTWFCLHFILGCRSLGCEVFILDRLGPSEGPENVRWLQDVLGRFGLERDFCLLDEEGNALAGCSRAEALARVTESDLLLNLNGYINDSELLEAPGQRVFVDIDPGLAQIWFDLGYHDAFAGHERFVTLGRRIGEPDCVIPDCGRDWIKIAPPVALSEWPVCETPAQTVTGIGNWRSDTGVIEYRGLEFGHRAREFRKFLALPQLTSREFEVVLNVHPSEIDDYRRLATHGWTVFHRLQVAADLDSYRRFIQGSGAELMVARGLYAAGQPGWFSERSACYLASGRPVIAQQTGIDGLYPTGAGLFTFETVEEAAAAVESVFGDYERHSKAARALAEAHFDASRVLGDLLEELGS